MILLLDNYDSFVFNLARYLEELGEDVIVLRNDSITPGDVLSLGPSHLVVSPGPRTPDMAGVANDVIRTAAGSIPILGVCLGHQCIGQVFGARLGRADNPFHGKVSLVHHRGRDLFAGLPSPLRGTRYHSLELVADSLPSDLLLTAWTDDGSVMAIRHASLPVWGVQFHPEAVLTQHGHAVLNNFLVLGRGGIPRGLEARLPPAEVSEKLQPAPPGLAAHGAAGDGSARSTRADPVHPLRVTTS